MDWIELIQLRSYTLLDGERAMAAFHQLASPDEEKGLMDIMMFRDVTLKNDICIFIQWNGPVPDKGKSPLGLQLAATFSQFGPIYHSVWTYDAGLSATKRRRIHAEEKAL